MCETLLIILAVLFIIITVGVISLGTVMIVATIRHRRELERLTKYQINTSANIDRSLPEILTMMITECFEDYKIKVLIPIDEGHINSEREEIIRRDLTSIVSNRISPAMLDKLSLYYNINNIAEVLADKVYITVMNYVVEHNELD